MYRLLRQGSRVLPSKLLKTKSQPMILNPFEMKGNLHLASGIQQTFATATSEDVSIESARRQLLESGQPYVRYLDVAIVSYNILETLEARIAAKDEIIKIMKENHAKSIKATEERAANAIDQAEKMIKEAEEHAAQMIKSKERTAALEIRRRLLAEQKILTELSNYRAIIDMRILIDRYMRIIYPEEDELTEDKVKRFTKEYLLNHKKHLRNEAKQCLQELEDRPVRNYLAVERRLAHLYNDLSASGETELSMEGSGYAVCVRSYPLQCKVGLFLVFAQRQIKAKEPLTFTERIFYWAQHPTVTKPTSSFQDGIVTSTRVTDDIDDAIDCD